jgi:hypothetical protein
VQTDARLQNQGESLDICLRVNIRCAACQHVHELRLCNCHCACTINCQALQNLGSCFKGSAIIKKLTGAGHDSCNYTCLLQGFQTCLPSRQRRCRPYLRCLVAAARDNIVTKHTPDRRSLAASLAEDQSIGIMVI